MLIKKPILAVLAILIVVAMLAEGLFVARVSEAVLAHEYHGLLNGKIGGPYQKLVGELRARYDTGDLEALGRALEAADDRKYEIDHVWPNDDTPDAFRDSVDQILE